MTSLCNVLPPVLLIQTHLVHKYCAVLMCDLLTHICVMLPRAQEFDVLVS